jgi:hypothetical protein
MVFVAPGAVFRRIAQSCGYGWTLAAQLFLLSVIGWSAVQTGLIDRQVDRRTQRALAELEKQEGDVLTRAELSERMSQIHKASEFAKLLVRGGAVLVQPLGLLVSVLLIAALLFAVVALTGSKPEFSTLTAICVYAAVVDVLASAVRLAMMLFYRSISVDTSLGLLVSSSGQGQTLHWILSAIDPFVIWFWVLVGVGLVVTGQLSRRAAVVVCVLFGLVSTAVRLGPSLRDLPFG